MARTVSRKDSCAAPARKRVASHTSATAADQIEQKRKQTGEPKD